MTEPQDTAPPVKKNLQNIWTVMIKRGPVNSPLVLFAENAKDALFQGMKYAAYEQTKEYEKVACFGPARPFVLDIDNYIIEDKEKQKLLRAG